MSKNLFRKGLATGAMIALAAIGFTATPASAAGEINVVPVVGTSYNTFVDAEFFLKSTLAPGFTPSNYDQVKYQITTDGSRDFYAVACAENSGASAQNLMNWSDDNDCNNSSSFTISSGTTDPVYHDAYAWDTSQNVLAIRPNYSTSGDATTSVKVVTFVDANNNGTLDSGEWQTTRTITFKKYSEVKATVALTKPAAGDTSLKAVVSYGDLNTEEASWWENFNVDFGGTTGASTNVSPNDYPVVSPATFEDGISGATKDDTVTATANYYSDADSSYVALGTTSSSVTPHSITDFGGTGYTLVKSADTVVDGDNYVRTNKAFTVTQLIKDTASTPAPKSGVAAKVYVDWNGGDLSSTRYITINGTKLDSNTKANDYAGSVTTDANGLASATVQTTGFSNGDYVYVEFDAEHYYNGEDVYAWDTEYSITSADKNDVFDAGYRRLAHQGTTTNTYAVKDQFGTNAVAGLRLAYNLEYHTSADGWIYKAGSGWNNVAASTPIVNGLATVTTVDPAGSNDWIYSYVWVQKQDAVTSNWSNDNNNYYEMDFNTDSTTATWNTTPNAAVDGTVTNDATFKVDGNNNVNLGYEADLCGSLVTISGAGLGFQLNGKLYTDTVSYYDYCDGTNTVKVYGYTAGDSVVTATVDGVASYKTTITFAPGTAKNVAIATPAQAQAGQAMDVVYTITDAHGNLTNDYNGINISSTGVGYLTKTGWVDTQTLGKYTTKLVTGLADLGTSYLKVVLQSDVLDTDLTVAKSVEYGLTDADVVSGGHRVFVDYEFAQGKTLTVTIDGVRKYSKVIGSDLAGELAFTQKKKGLHTVTVRISGGIVFTEHVRTN